MPPRRLRKQPLRPAQTSKGRVVRILSPKQWDTILSKLGDRLLIVEYYSVSLPACQRMRLIFADFSRRQEYSHVTFADIDVNRSDDVLQHLENNVSQVPTFQCWRNGLPVETVSSTAPATIVELLNRHAGEKPRERNNRLLIGGGIVLAGLVAAAGYVGYSLLQGKRQPPSEEEFEQFWNSLDLSESLVEGPERDLKKVQTQLRELRQKIRAAAQPDEIMGYRKDIEARMKEEKDLKRQVNAERARIVAEGNVEPLLPVPEPIDYEKADTETLPLNPEEVLVPGEEDHGIIRI